MSNELDIQFKSIPLYWEREQRGLKRNTLRAIDKDDKRFKILRKCFDNLDKYDLWIRIINTHTNEVFDRLVTDIYYDTHNQVLISWN